MEEEIQKLMDAMEAAWGLIANARDFYIEDPDEQSREWISYAERWRDEHWHPALERNYQYIEADLPPPIK